jgi:hypothetical protein
LIRQPTSHWIWEPYSTERGMAFVTGMDGLDGDIQRRVLRGEALERSPELTVTEMTKGRLYDVLGVPTGILFVAPVLKGVLDQASRATSSSSRPRCETRRSISTSWSTFSMSFPPSTWKNQRTTCSRGQTPSARYGDSECAPSPRMRRRYSCRGGSHADSGIRRPAALLGRSDQTPGRAYACRGVPAEVLTASWDYGWLARSVTYTTRPLLRISPSLTTSSRSNGTWQLSTALITIYPQCPRRPWSFAPIGC